MPKKKHNIQLNAFVSQIPKNNLWLPGPHLSLSNSNQLHPTCFSIKQSNPNNVTNFSPLHIAYDSTPDVMSKAVKVDIQFTKAQQLIVQQWFNASTAMYNETINVIKYQIKNSGNIYKTVHKTQSLDWQKVRTLVNPMKLIICNRSAFKSDGKSKICIKKCLTNCKCNNSIKMHDLDLIIKLATEMYQSALTNFKRKNIKQFRVKKWKYDRKVRLLKLEKTNFTSGSIRNNILGTVKGYNNGKNFDFKTIGSDCTLIYNEFTNKYTLCVTETVQKSYNLVQEKLISLDPGIRTFMTGISDRRVVKIGNDVSKKIEYYLKKLDALKTNTHLTALRKKSKEMLYNRKISNFVDELHWKSIRYLTNNYNVILIGDMSCIGVTNKKNSKLNDITKRISYRLKFSQFRQRLKYKCNVMNVNYKCVDEKYTSMTCSICGNINKSLGGNKMYDCKSCKRRIDRDVNGARNIYIKGSL